MIALLLLAIGVGLLLPIQAGVNAQLRLALGATITTAFISFLVGTVGLLVLLLATRAPFAIGEAWARSEPWQWVGGLLGAVYIAAAVVLAPRLGAATLIAAVVAGQMIASIVLDHFGWVGFAEHPASGLRLLGAALVVLGVVLIQR